MTYRTALQSISHFISNMSYQGKKAFDKQRFPTLRSVCELAGIEIGSLDQTVVDVLDDCVSYICRYGDRFTKDCICVQLYDDTDEIMRLAVRKGAIVCVTDHIISGLRCIVVPDTHETYATLCSIWRKYSKAQGTAVCGSIGKTTTKKMINEVYRQGFFTWCDSGNDNILDSIGSICQHVPKKAEQIVVEFSEDTPGTIKRMAEIIVPNICVITDIDKSHIEFYGSETNIVEEFNSVLSCLPRNGVCITNYDNENNRSLVTRERIVFVSLYEKTADYYADGIIVDSSGLLFTIHEKATGNFCQIRLYNSFAVHNVYSAMMAFAAGVQSGMSYERIAKGLSYYRPSGFRQNIYRSGKTTIYADCFNAVAKSVQSAIVAADQIPVTGKRVAVLGDVAEAGSYTQSTHMEIVDIVEESSFHVLMTCGRELKKAFENKNHRNDLLVLTFNTQNEMNKALKRKIRNGDLVLFKSSHSGNLQSTIRSVFPLAYFYQMLKYYIPRLAWHFKVLIN